MNVKECREIKVGEYVRTKKYGIFKVIKLEKTIYGYSWGETDNSIIFSIGKDGSYEIKNDIIKHSKNLIDIIEVRRLCEWV